MAILRYKEVDKMNEHEVLEKLKELRTELIKSRVATKKVGKLNPREIKRNIAKLLTKLTQINKNKKTEKKIKTTKKEAKK